MPRPRPPYPSIQGLWDGPTLHQQRRDARRGPAHPPEGRRLVRLDRHRAVKGTKVFALTGKIVNSGLVEVPMGITLKELVMDIGGGSASGKPIKAAQPAVRRAV